MQRDPQPDIPSSTWWGSQTKASLENSNNKTHHLQRIPTRLTDDFSSETMMAIKQEESILQCAERTQTII